MKGQQRESAAANQIVSAVSVRILGNHQRMATCMTSKLLLPIMVIALLQAGIAFGAGERFLGNSLVPSLYERI